MKEKLIFNNVKKTKEGAEMKENDLEEKKDKVKELIKSGNGYDALDIIQTVEGEEYLKWREKLQSEVAAVFYGSKDFETIKQNLDKVDIKGVKQILDATENKSSYEGRLKKFKLLFPQDEYNRPKPEEKVIINPKSPSDFIKNSLVKKNLDRALQLIQEYETDINAGKYKNEEKAHFTPHEKLKHRKDEFIKACYDNNQLERIFPFLKELRKTVKSTDQDSEKYPELARSLDHKENKLFKAFIKVEEWEGAQKVIDSMIDTKHNEKYHSKENRQAKLVQEKSEDKKEKSDTNDSPSKDA